MVGIERPRTEAEKKDFMDVKTWHSTDFKQNSIKHIIEQETKFLHKKQKPYCSKCANDAVEEKERAIEKYIQKQIIENKKDVKLDVRMKFEEYGDEKKFQKVDESEIREDKLIDGMKQNVETGKYHNYVCKDCGAHISIQVLHRDQENTKTKNPADDKK